MLTTARHYKGKRTSLHRPCVSYNSALRAFISLSRNRGNSAMVKRQIKLPFITSYDIKAKSDFYTMQQNTLLKLSVLTSRVKCYRIVATA